MGRRFIKLVSKVTGKELAKELNTLGSELIGLTTDTAMGVTKVASGTASVARQTVEATTVDNVKNVFTYTADIVAGNDIGTANADLAEAIENGNMGKVVANYCLEAVHGKAEYRAKAKEIEDKIKVAEDELDVLLAEAELLTLEQEAQAEIARLNAEAEQMKANA